MSTNIPIYRHSEHHFMRVLATTTRFSADIDAVPILESRPQILTIDSIEQIRYVCRAIFSLSTWSSQFTFGVLTLKTRTQRNAQKNFKWAYIFTIHNNTYLVWCTCIWMPTDGCLHLLYFILFYFNSIFYFARFVRKCCSYGVSNKCWLH